MNLLKNMDEWSQGLFWLICCFLLFMLFFYMKAISNALVESMTTIK